MSITGLGTTGNTVKANFIGITLGGTAALGNEESGVVLTNTTANTVGGTTGGTGNVISGNSDDGVLITGGSANFVQANLIGTRTGGLVAIANSRHGIHIDESPGNTIGLDAFGPGNLISGNGGSGIYLQGGSTTGTLIAGNTMGPHSRAPRHFPMPRTASRSTVSAPRLSAAT